MILAIETAVSLVGMNDTNHGKRVGYIACQLAHQLNWSEEDTHYAFDLGLLHDCGVSTEQMHSNLVNHFDWHDAYIHCQIGHRLLKEFEPLAHFSTPILYHHTKWESLKNLDISQHDKHMANLVFLADRIDILASTHYDNDILLAREQIVESITGYQNSYFNPDFVQAFQQAEKSEAFWIALEDRHITRYTWDMRRFKSSRTLPLPQLKKLSMILAYIVDQKSPFTAQHSLRVANLARFIASTLELPEGQCDKIEIAALLHDLGKLHTPDHILSKAGPLNDIERSIMNQHSYETYEILRNINGLEDIALWAAYHHEGINGTGYPFHPDKNDISIEARIIAVADVFQALAQNRPYREGMALAEILNLMDDFSSNGKLDRALVDLTKKYAETCFDLAKTQEDSHHSFLFDS